VLKDEMLVEVKEIGGWEILTTYSARRDDEQPTIWPVE